MPRASLRAGTATPSPTGTATPSPGSGTRKKVRLRFTGLRLRPNKARRIRFRISCGAGAPAACKGRFRLVTRLKRKTRFVASRRFAVKPGRSKVVNPIVRRRVYRALKRGKKIRLRVRLTGRAGIVRPEGRHEELQGAEATAVGEHRKSRGARTLQ